MPTRLRSRRHRHSTTPFALLHLETRRLLAGAANAVAMDCIDHLDEAGALTASDHFDDFHSGRGEGDSVGSTWGSGPQNLEYSYRNLTNGGLPGGLSSAQIHDIMEEAMLLWTAVAPLRMTEVIEGGSPDHV